jgi:hypothetical protein
MGLLRFRRVHKRIQNSSRRLEPHRSMPSDTKRVTPLKPAHVIDPAHSGNIIPEKLSLTEYAEDESEDSSNDRI